VVHEPYGQYEPEEHNGRAVKNQENMNDERRENDIVRRVSEIHAHNNPV
jgi:hypothetical protein